MQHLKMMHENTFTLLLISQIICLLFLFFHYLKRKLPITKVQEKTGKSPIVSIIICAHNESENLTKNLPKILTQRNIEADVIVVNDRSTDDSKTLLEKFAKEYKNLKVIEVTASEKLLPGKKYLLGKALEFSNNEKIIVTDADCMPASENWAHTLVSFLQNNQRIVLGFSPFKKQKTFLNKFIRFEATQTAWLYLSMAAKGKAYMGVGRNMAFYKSDFLNWYKSTEHKIAGGDDDLFVNAIADKQNVALCLTSESYVFTDAKQSWGDFLMQKARHVQASFYYKKSDQMLLFVFALAQFWVLMLPFFTDLNHGYFALIAIIWLTLQTVLSFKTYKKLAQNDLVCYIPLLQAIFMLYLMIVFLLSLLKERRTWN